MATSFHVVFETMVDTLIGDKEFDKIKNLGDGKIIDHIYKDYSILTPDKVFYIGDSKYYGVGQGPKDGSESVYKQFSYARTIVNDEIRKNIGLTWPYRDEMTEGYCVIPNFFISAETDPKLEFHNDGFDYASNKDCIRFRFQVFGNRLFDRDTLWVRQYNLNFLYLLSVYAAADSTAMHAFRDKARRFFRKGTIELLNREYEFFLLEPKVGTLEAVLANETKWLLRGHCYRLGIDGEKLLLALEIPTSTTALSDPSEVANNIDIINYYNAIRPVVESSFDCTRCRLNEEDKELPIPVDDPSGTYYYFVN